MDFTVAIRVVGVPDQGLDLHYYQFQGANLIDSCLIKTLPEVVAHFDLKVVDDGDRGVIFTRSRLKGGKVVLIAHHIERDPICFHAGDIRHLVVGPSWVGTHDWEEETFAKWDVEGNRLEEISLYTDGYNRKEKALQNYRNPNIDCFTVWGEDVFFTIENRVYLVAEDEEWAKEPIGRLGDCGKILKMIPFGDVLTVIFKTRPYYPRSTSGRDTAHYGYRKFGVLEKKKTIDLYELVKQKWIGTDDLRKRRGPEDMAVSPCGQFFYETNLDHIHRRTLGDNLLGIQPICSKDLKGLNRDQRIKNISPLKMSWLSSLRIWSKD